ncbi:hypothetical protein L914_18825, partial [Phytophthora nicotianae]
MNRRLPKRDRTWTNLKKALLRRYGEKLDKSAAEWRVNMRRMMPGETYADFAAALRDVVGRNKVSERVLLAQFCRSLDKTTKKLVKQRPKPRTLEEAVDKANEIDDPMDNVALGMMNIGQPWATAPSPYLVPVDGTTGQTLVIPGIGGTGLSTELMAAGLNGTTTTDGDGGVVALFTNPRGVWNKYSGTWDVPSGRVWNGQFWYEPKKNARKRSPEDQQLRKPKDAKKPARTFKTRIEPTPSSRDESDVRPPKKRMKAAVRQTTEPRAESRTEQRMNSGQSTRRPAVQVSSGHPGCRRCGQLGHWMAQSEMLCLQSVRSFRQGLHRRRREGPEPRIPEEPSRGQEDAGKREADAVSGLRRSDKQDPHKERGRTTMGGTRQEHESTSGEQPTGRRQGGVRMQERDDDDNAEVEIDNNDGVSNATLATYDEELEELWSKMMIESSDQDDERAARYVATVRPAMATTRYVHSGSVVMQDDVKDDSADVVEPSGENNGRSEEGANPCLREVLERTEDTQDNVVTEVPGVLTDERDNGVNQNIAQIRQARRLVRNQKKRERVKRAIARRRSA